VGAKLAQMQPLAGQSGKDPWHCGMQLTHRKLVHSRIHAVRLYARDRLQQCGVDQPISCLMSDDGELHDMFPTDGGDQLLRTAES